MTPEQCAENALIHVGQHNQAKTKARFGSDEKRSFYRRLAQRHEVMVGVWMTIEKAKRVAAK